MPVPNQAPRALRQPWPIFPPIFAAFPVLSVYATNQGTLPIDELWRPLLVAVGVSLLLWVVLAVPLRSVQRSAATMAAIVPCAYLYSWWVRLPVVQGLALTTYCILVLGLAATATWRLKATGPLNLLALLLLAFVGFRIAMGLVHPVEISHAGRAHIVANPSSGTKPDIYYIILDGYGRQDALKRTMGFDNSPFVAELEKRGFYVAAKSHSNYCQTEISLGSSLNMDLMQALAPDEKPSTSDRWMLDRLVNKNRLARDLKSLGYQTVAITSGFPAFQFSSADVRLPEHSRYSLLESTLLQMTPFAASNEGVNSMFIQRRETLLGAFQNLRSMAGRASKPRFVFAHILAPHPPFVFGPNGEVLPHRGPYGFWDGSDFMQYVGKPADYRKGYVGQIQWLNGQVLGAVDQILAMPGPKPVILLQGDHGSKLRLDQVSLARTDVTECFENLMAYEVPPSVRRKLYPTITPVNSFRLIMSTLFGQDLPLLPDKSWYSPFPHPFEFTDVTERVTDSG